QCSGSNSDADALGDRHEHMLRLYFHLLLRLLDPGHPPRAAIHRRLRSWSCRHVRTWVRRMGYVGWDLAPRPQNAFSVSRVPISIHIWMQPLQETSHMAPRQFARSARWKAKNAV